MKNSFIEVGRVGRRRMYIGHVGDSRCYRVRGGQIQLLTRDHSLINDYLLAMPDLTEEQRSELPKNVITRALGMQDQVVVDIQHDEPRPGDVYCLCSDGLSGMVQDEEILKIVSSATDIGEACRNLIARANEHGGEDNITAVLIKIEEQIDSSTQEIPVLGLNRAAGGLDPTRTAPLPTIRSGAAAPAPDDLGMTDEPTAPGFGVTGPSRKPT